VNTRHLSIACAMNLAVVLKRERLDRGRLVFEVEAKSRHGSGRFAFATLISPPVRNFTMQFAGLRRRLSPHASWPYLSIPQVERLSTRSPALTKTFAAASDVIEKNAMEAAAASAVTAQQA